MHIHFELINAVSNNKIYRLTIRQHHLSGLDKVYTAKIFYNGEVAVDFINCSFQKQEASFPQTFKITCAESNNTLDLDVKFFRTTQLFGRWVNDQEIIRFDHLAL